jgi:hypothetical protein
MNAVVPLLPKNINIIPSGKHLWWEAFEHVCLNLCSKKQQNALLAKKCKKQKSASPPSNNDEAMTEIDRKTASSIPDGWMHQKGHIKKLPLSVKMHGKSKAFQRSSAEGVKKPDHSPKEI